MLDRKIMLIVSAFVLAMLAAAIWLLAYQGRWSVMPFTAPAGVVMVAAGLRWRLARASGDLSAWTKWAGFFAISYAAICAGFQLVLVVTSLKVIATPLSPLMRLFFALFGVQFFILGNWIAKLPPLEIWRPAWLSLGVEGEAAMLRFGGWLFVGYGLILVGSAFLIPVHLIAPVVVSMTLASLIVVVIRRRQLRAQY
jgi:hypothetical protein